MKSGIKLNLGSGLIPLEGFVNMDKEYDGWDICKGMPQFKDNSIEAITASHLFCALDEKDFPFVFKEIYRVLEEDGVFRICDVNCDQPKKILQEYELIRSTMITHPTRWMMYEHLKKAGFETHDVCDKTTFYRDDSLIQKFHGDYKLDFHIEGIKRS